MTRRKLFYALAICGSAGMYGLFAGEMHPGWWYTLLGLPLGLGWYLLFTLIARPEEE